MSYEPPKDPWLIGAVSTGAEQKVSERLRETDQEVFYPKAITMTRVGDRRRMAKVEKPRYPSYIFVRAETVDFLDPVYQDSRFRGFLKVADSFGFIHEAEIQQMKAWDGCIAPVVEAPKPQFSTGDVVELIGFARVGEIELRDKQVWFNGYDLNMAIQISDLTLLKHHVKCAA